MRPQLRSFASSSRRLHDGGPDTVAPLIRQDDDVLKIEGRLGKERGIGEEVQGATGGLSVRLREERAEVQPLGEVGTETFARLGVRSGQVLVVRQRLEQGCPLEQLGGRLWSQSSWSIMESVILTGGLCLREASRRV